MKIQAILTLLTLTSFIPTVADVKDSPEEVTPLDLYEQIPNPLLTRLDSSVVTLSEAIGGKPAVLIFFRGGWCPYCTKHLAAISDVLPAIIEKGYVVIAISPDTIEDSQRAVDEKQIAVTVLCDSEFEAIRQFGLAFKLDEETLKKYDEYGISLVSEPETDSKVLPVPAVFVVDSEGVIQYRHYDPDYKERLEPEDLLDVINGL